MILISCQLTGKEKKFGFISHRAGKDTIKERKKRDITSTLSNTQMVNFPLQVKKNKQTYK